VQVLRSVEPDRLAAARERGEFVWIDLADPSPEDVDRLGDLFGLHPLALEDTQRFGQDPKLERYGDWLLLVFYGATPEGLAETHLFLSADWLITVRRSPCVSLEALREDSADDDRLIVYRVLDALTDSFFGVLRRVDNDIEALEDRILEGEVATARRDVVDLRRRVLGFRRVLLAQRDAFDAAGSELSELPGLSAAAGDYFRDVRDNVGRLAARADIARERLMAVLDMADNAATNRLSRVVERLTLVSTIFLPLTALFSFFGMNFSWMIETIDTLGAFLALGLALPLTIAVGLLLYFWRRGLFRS
jgi:magnesium transporter